MILEHSKIILDELDCGIIVLDESLNILFWNKWLSNRTKKTNETVRNKNLLMLYPDINEKILKRNIMTTLVLNTSTFYQAPQSNYLLDIPLEHIISKIFNHMQQKVTIAPYDAKQKHIAIYIYDITTACEANYKLKMLNQDLEKRVKYEIQKSLKKDSLIRSQHKQAAMGNLISVIAHQLKQPLDSMGLTTENLKRLLKKEDSDKTSIRNKIDKIRDSIFFMSSTIDDFKDFFNPHKKAKLFSIKDSIDKAITLLETQLKQKFIQLEFDYKKDIKIESYESELIQVILNIVNNAEDALLEMMTDKPLISISLKASKNKALILLRDNAGGISEPLLSKIFDPYFTTKGSKGTGIGLNICKKIIEESLGGKLKVENCLNGAQFTIELPISKSQCLEL